MSSFNRGSNPASSNQRAYTGTALMSLRMPRTRHTENSRTVSQSLSSVVDLQAGTYPCRSGFGIPPDLRFVPRPKRQCVHLGQRHPIDGEGHAVSEAEVSAPPPEPSQITSDRATEPGRRRGRSCISSCGRRATPLRRRPWPTRFTSRQRLRRGLHHLKLLLRPR